MFKSHLQAVNWSGALHMVTLRLNENKLMANEKGICKTSRGDLLDRSSPKWAFLATSRISKPVRKSTRSRSLILLTETSEIKWFSVNCLGLLQRKRLLLHISKKGCLVSPFKFVCFFLTGINWATEQQTHPYIIILIIINTINIITIIIKWRR